jgi:hypothetical protein
VALQSTHERYASYWNAAQVSSGYVWQGRFHSCPLDEGHLCNEWTVPGFLSSRLANGLAG